MATKVPAGLNGGATTNFYFRFRLTPPETCTSVAPTGFVAGGEVEDYLFNLGYPTAIDLLSFDATAAKKAIILSWETGSETDNLGFNLYRATSVDGQKIKLNAELIPTQAPPGSTYGAEYKYRDTTVKGRTYYYWLEDVDIYGATTLHEPPTKAKPK
jgi:hypothetical protein